MKTLMIHDSENNQSCYFLEGTCMAGRVVHCKRESYDIYIGRPGKWGNPFPLQSEDDRDRCIEKYRAWLEEQPDLIEAAKRDLKDKVLGCWCAPRACHGDVLLEIANVSE